MTKMFLFFLLASLNVYTHALPQYKQVIFLSEKKIKYMNIKSYLNKSTALSLNDLCL